MAAVFGGGSNATGNNTDYGGLAPSAVGDGRADNSDPRTFWYNGQLVDPRTVQGTGGTTYAGPADQYGYIAGQAPANAAPAPVFAPPAPAPAPSSGGAVFGGGSNMTGAPAPSSAPAPAAPAPSGQPRFNLSSVATEGPEKWNVSGDQTVAEQLAKVLGTDSPLMQQARTRALQAANARGLANSSMAVSAGEAAMYDAALPIAQADAGTYASAAQANAGAANTFRRDNNQFARESEMANFNLGANDWAAQRQLERDLQRDAANKTDVDEQEAATLKRGYINAINQARTDYAEKFTNISASTTMSAELKAETLASLKATYNTMIRNYAQLAGWDPASWIIGTEEAAAPAPAPGAAPAPAPGAPGSYLGDYTGSGA